MPVRPRNITARPLAIASSTTLILTGVRGHMAMAWFGLSLRIGYTIVGIRNGGGRRF
jgi:hypothetical protein